MLIISIDKCKGIIAEVMVIGDLGLGGDKMLFNMIFLGKKHTNTTSITSIIINIYKRVFFSSFSFVLTSQLDFSQSFYYMRCQKRGPFIKKTGGK